MPKPKSPFKRAFRAFDFEALKRICEMHETEFAEAYGLEQTAVDQQEPADFFLFKDNNASILAVAHLDTVVHHDRRMCNWMQTAAGPVIFSGALDDRLGAYTILELMPTLGIKFDVLLTTGEEVGRSTASYFQDGGVEYNWVIEFDRGGTDVVMYQYEDAKTRDLVKASGARVGMGSYSDIAFMEHLKLKAFNWGVGYRDYHTSRGHVFLEDYVAMMGTYLRFHEANEETYLPHEPRKSSYYYGRYGSSIWDEVETDKDVKVEKDYEGVWPDDDTIETTAVLAAPEEPLALEARKDAERDEAEYEAMNRAWR